MVDKQHPGNSPEEITTRQANESDEIERSEVENAEQSRRVQELAAQLAEQEQAVRSLSRRLAKKDRQVQWLEMELQNKTAEIERMKNTLGWRLLQFFGPIKYRFLMPIYRRFNADRSSHSPTVSRPNPSSSDTTSMAADGTADWSDALSIDRGDSQGAEQPSCVSQSPEPAFESGDVAITSNKHDVVCFPIIEWEFRFQRPQQLMAQFAAAGHRVFYISQRFRTSGKPYLIIERRENLFEVSLRGKDLNPYTDTLDVAACDELFKSLDALRHDLMLGATVALVQLPFWWELVKRARERFTWPLVYDYLDYHAGFSTNRPAMLKAEDDLLASASLVTVSSSFLENEARRHNSNIVMIRNACDYEHFAIDAPPKNARPVVGYYGAIADWFDADLVADLARRRPDWDFVLIGSTFSLQTSRLARLANVSLIGEKPYAEIPSALSTFDVAFIPFKRTPLTEATNPVKAYEILAAGKPLVSVPIPEMEALAPLVRLASTVDEFEREISAALDEHQPELIEARRAFAREQTWRNRFEALAPAVRDVFPKASIVIVTYNNLELNRLCVESLYSQTEWPNYEVFIVDNASLDGTPDYLQQIEQKLQNLRIILNEDNRGFAAANNQALKQATGDILVLLNNDTVVPRGWLSRLIHHLSADPSIGLIGPMTNAVGNEAKVDVGYKQVREMPEWAARHVQAHDGETADIPMLAMFCVAMRREVFEKVGLLDEQFGIGMFEDDDYTLRIRAEGLRVVCAADVFIHHFGQAAFKKLIERGEYDQLFNENRRRYEAKWGRAWIPHKHAPLKFERRTPTS